MANQLKMGQKMILYQLFQDGWSERKISRATGIHRKTIHRYRLMWQELQKQTGEGTLSEEQTDLLEEIPGNCPQGVPSEVTTGSVVHFQVTTDSEQKRKSKSKVFIYDSIIREKLEGGQNAKSIYQDLYLEQGYRGSYESVKRYVRKLRHAHPKLYARIETPPGLEAQVDFGLGALTLKEGRYKRPWLFVMTLSNSRASYQQVVWKQDVETFLSCHEKAFEFFGGVPKTIKIDNLKAGVLKAHLYEPELNPNYQAFSEHYNFVILPCRVATPQHKGKVESGVKYVQNNALTNKRFDSLEAQNRYLQKWNTTWAMRRIHGTTKRQVRQMFEKERPSLQKTAEEPYAFFKIATRKVSIMDSHVQLEGAYYPVAPQYMGKQVRVHYNLKWVKIYFKADLIQHLSRIPKGTFHPDQSCFPAHKRYDRERFQQRQLSQCTLLGQAVNDWAVSCKKERGLQAIRAIQGVIALKRKYPARTINRACAKALQENLFNYHAVYAHAKKLYEGERIQKELTFLQENELIRSPRSYAAVLEEKQ